MHFKIVFVSRCLKKNPDDRETSSELYRLSREYKPSREEEELAESWSFEKEKNSFINMNEYKHDLKTQRFISVGDEFLNKKYLVIKTMGSFGQGNIVLVEEKETSKK